MPETIQTRLDPVSFDQQLERIVVGDDAVDHPNTERILSRARDFGLELCEEVPDTDNRSVNARYRIEKSTIKLRMNHGSFIKPWESPQSIVGRDEWCLTPVEGCPLDCNYCYLQDYLDRPLIQIFVNQERIAEHVQSFMEDPPESPPHFFSLGELSDGLFLEPITRTIPLVWDVFRESSGKLEVRTKSHHLGDLLSEIEPHPNGVFTWTLSPEGPDRRDEMLTSTLEQRINALQYTLEQGFRVSVRIDPIILRENWFEDYATLIGRLAEAVSLEDLTFLLLGVFRFPKGFDRTMEERFPNRDFLRDEFVEGPDGKLRYAREIRTEVYEQLGEVVRDYGGDPNLCMEPEYVWEDAGFID